MAENLQGSYFFEAYASKVFRGQPASEALVSRLFLTGFGASAALAPALGRLVAAVGPRAGAFLGALIGALGALSARASTLPVLLMGRVAGGVSTSLLTTAPESWLAGEQARGGHPASWLSETLSLAYLGGSVVSVLAGQLSEVVAAKGGPTAPFALSHAFLLGAAALVAGTWHQGEAAAKTPPGKVEGVASGDESCNVTVSDAWRVMRAEPRMLAVGAVQALFESAMYTSFMQWTPALRAAAPGSDIPLGKVFSCFQASCMLGASAFGRLAQSHPAEGILAGALAAATGAMGAVAAAGRSSLAAALGGFLVFEVCVGVYFPAIGTLRSKHVPDSHRSVVTSMFEGPSKLLVAAAMLAARPLGLRGSLASCVVLLQGAFLAQTQLRAAERAAPRRQVPGRSARTG